MRKTFTLLAFIVLRFVTPDLVAQPIGWLYSLPVTVSNPNGVNAVDYQLKITVNTQLLINNNHMHAQGNDIRFATACNSTTFLNYWIEGGINTTTTAIWVKIPFIGANASTTIFMFYGNPTAAAASSIPGTFRGPNSSTDSVVGANLNAVPGICQRGFRFAPTQDMLVTHFGKYEPNGSLRYVTLFNYNTQAILSQTQVAGPADTYTYGAIPNPLWLTNGTQYVLQFFGNSNEGYYYGTSNQIGQHLVYYEMQYSNGGTQNTFPNSVLANYHYGHGDFLYYITNTLALTPSYTVAASALNIYGSSPICAGSSVTLTTNATGSYTWNTGAMTPSIVVSPSSSATYSISQGNFSGCITILVNQGIPSLTVVNTASLSAGICPNQTVNLSASGASSYTWAGGSTTVTNGVTFSPTLAATYTVTGANGCGTSSAVTSVSVHPMPLVTPVASSSTLCAGSSLTLTAQGNASTYTWTGGSVPFSNGVGFVPTTSTIYTLTGTSALNCSIAATIPVTVYVSPTLAPTASPLIVCLGGSSTLSASGALNYTWTSATQTVNTSTMIVTPTTTGISTYTITKANSSCSDTKIINVVTNAAPVVAAIAMPATVCALSPATLAAGGAQSYTWTAPGTPNYTFTGASNIISTPMPATYSVTASDGTCIATATVFLATNPIPTIAISASSSSICSGQPVTLNASGGNNYTWTTGSGTLQGATITESPSIPVSYQVTGDNSFGCTAQASQIVLVFNSPTLSAGPDKNLICNGTPVTFSASGASAYTWEDHAGIQGTGPQVVIQPTAAISGPVIYTLTGSDNIGCTGTKTTQVQVFIPVLSISGSTNACYGSTLTLSASGANSSSYSWNTGGGIPLTGASITTSLTAPTVFTVSAASTSLAITCPVSQTIAVDLHPNPDITAAAQRTTICVRESVDLYAGGGDSYLWNNGASGGTINVSPLIQTSYTVTGTDLNGCKNTATVQVRVSACVGISETAPQDLIALYPNPNRGEFTIKAGTEMQLILVNELGQLIQHIELSAANNYQVAVKALSQGIYFVTGKKDQVQIHQKIIVTQ
jgi:hypothetical protein